MIESKNSILEFWDPLLSLNPLPLLLVLLLNRKAPTDENNDQ